MLSYEIQGAGSPVVLLHGGALNSRAWDGQFAFLAQHHTIIRYDARGHGLSPTPTEPFAHYEDLRQLLDTLGMDQGIRERCLEMITDTVTRHGPTGQSLMTDLDGINRVAELRAPILTLVGDLDSSDIHAVADLLGHKQVISGAGHNLNLERPDEFNRAVLEFLAQRSRT
jgi:pimeloyl-ACP methyl ester carboxylesterase